MNEYEIDSFIFDFVIFLILKRSIIILQVIERNIYKKIGREKKRILLIEHMKEKRELLFPPII
jgi:hypothetical protein